MTQPTHQTPSVVLSASSLADIAKDLSGSTVRSVQNILGAVRQHLDMDVAFVSEFVGTKRYFRNVDARNTAPIRIGDARPLDEGYCRRVVDGSLPELIRNTATVPLAASLPDTRDIPVGSHLSVPIRLRDGRVYGTFCCFNFEPDESLNERDLSVLRAFADIAAYQIDQELETSTVRSEKSRRILSAIDRSQPGMAYQPVLSLADLRVVGVECLSRFDLDPDLDPDRGPDDWFADAADIGHGTVLELQAIRNALRGLRSIAFDADVRVWLNVSARTVIDGRVADHLESFDPHRIVLELTEHEHVEDYGVLNRALDPLRERGVGVAIDDAGAGYSSMSHILNIAPDFIKLDLSLTRHIDTDRKRRALAAALIEFGRQTDAMIVAEGVESVAELNELRRLGVQMAQGYFLSEPVGVDALVAVLATFRDRPVG